MWFPDYRIKRMRTPTPPPVLSPSPERLRMRALIEAAATGSHVEEPAPVPPPTLRFEKPEANPETFGEHRGLFRDIGGLQGWNAVFVTKTHCAPASWRE